jgi:hypothetical protein
MTAEPSISVIAHVIQLSVAPVFLFAGIGAILMVMTNRLARIVDRARVIEARLTDEPDGPGPIHAEMLTLERRARNISLAIGLCTTTALLVSAVVAVLFLNAFFSYNTSTAIAVLFIAAMLTLIAALILLLREVLLGTATLRFGPHRS